MCLRGTGGKRKLPKNSLGIRVKRRIWKDGIFSSFRLCHDRIPLNFLFIFRFSHIFFFVSNLPILSGISPGCHLPITQAPKRASHPNDCMRGGREATTKEVTRTQRGIRSKGRKTSGSFLGCNGQTMHCSAVQEKKKRKKMRLLRASSLSTAVEECESVGGKLRRRGGKRGGRSFLYKC